MQTLFKFLWMKWILPWYPYLSDGILFIYLQMTKLFFSLFFWNSPFCPKLALSLFLLIFSHSKNLQYNVLLCSSGSLSSGYPHRLTAGSLRPLCLSVSALVPSRPKCLLKWRPGPASGKPAAFPGSPWSPAQSELSALASPSGMLSKGLCLFFHAHLGVNLDV